MFKVEIEFDKTLPADQIEELCQEIDQIFAEENVSCIDSSFGKRIYCSEDYGDTMCGVLSIDEDKELVSHINKATLYHGDFEPEDLIKECFSYEAV